jgi:hypothetical protein
VYSFLVCYLRVFIVFLHCLCDLTCGCAISNFIIIIIIYNNSYDCLKYFHFYSSFFSCNISCKNKFFVPLNVSSNRQHFFSLCTTFCLKEIEVDVLIRLERNSLRDFIVLLIITCPFASLLCYECHNLQINLLRPSATTRKLLEKEECTVICFVMSHVFLLSHLN